MSKTTYISEVNGQKVYAERAGYTTNGVNIDTALGGKQDDLGISAAGSATEFLNEQGNFVPVSSSNMAVPRSYTDYDNDQPGRNKAVFIEKANSSTNTPYNSWHYLMAMTGGDADYCTQVVFPMQNDNRMFYRTHHGNQGWSDWQEVARTSQVPIYVTSSDTFSTIETAYTAGRLPFYKYTATFSSRKIAIPMQLIRVDYTDNTFTTIQAFEFGFVDYTDSNLYGKLWKIKCDRTSGWGSLFGTLPAALQNMYNTSVTDFNDFNSTLNSMKFQSTDTNQSRAPNTTSYFNVLTGIGGNTGYQTQIATECGNAKTGLYVRSKYNGTWTGWKEMAAANEVVKKPASETTSGIAPLLAYLPSTGTGAYRSSIGVNFSNGRLSNVSIPFVSAYDALFGSGGAGPYYWTLGELTARGSSGISDILFICGMGDIGNVLNTCIVTVGFRGSTPDIHVTTLTGTCASNTDKRWSFGWHIDSNNKYQLILKQSTWFPDNIRIRYLHRGNALTLSPAKYASTPSGVTYATTYFSAIAPMYQKTGDTNKPVYVDESGMIKQCSTYISMGTAVADSNVLCVF